MRGEAAVEPAADDLAVMDDNAADGDLAEGRGALRLMDRFAHEEGMVLLQIGHEQTPFGKCVIFVKYFFLKYITER